MSTRIKKPTQSGRASRRRGVAVVEAALCLPIIVLLMLGTLEVCAAFHLRESLTVAAYEGARTGVKRRATAEDARARVMDILAARNVTDAQIEIIPDDFSTLDALDPITIRVTANTQGNAALVFDAMVDVDVSADVVMVREFGD